jgi:hypothetical protein
MNLGELISVRVNFDKTMERKLLEMTTYFQGHLWDGCSDEDDPKFISKADFDALEALVGKIEHMVFNIGCPISVDPMIQSIITRRLKHWQGSDSVETKDRKNHTAYKDENGITRLKTIITKGHRKGKQLKTKAEKRVVLQSFEYGATKRGAQGHILTGHFRWNNRGYILSRRATEILESFYYNNFGE